MSPLTAAAIYVVIWWLTLFAVLPLGAQSHAEAGLDLKDGGDPGAPVTPNLKRKFITTTWVAGIVWVVVIATLLSGVFDLLGLGYN